MKNKDERKKHLLDESQASNGISDLQAEQVKMVYKTAPLGTLTTSLTSAILIFILWSVISHTVLITWFVCNLLITSIRYTFVFRYWSASAESKRVGHWGTSFTLGMLFNGILWGSAGIFLFPSESIPHQVFLAFVLGAMAIGGVGLYSALKEVALAYTLPAMIPITIQLFIQGSDIHVAMGVMSLLFLSIMLVVSKHIHWSIVNSLKLRFENSDLLTYLATAKDNAERLNGKLHSEVAERKQTENMLRESEARFRDLVDNSLIGIYIIQQGQIVYKNSEQDRIFGPLPRPFDFNHSENVHPEDVEKVKEAYERILSGEIQNFDIEMRFFPTGELNNTADMKWVHCRASVIEYQGQEAILVNMKDVTHTRELEHLVRIDDKMISLGRIAAGIIHELRNPLSGINVYLTTLRKIYNYSENVGLENLEKVEEIIGKLQSASGKIESVIKRVMDFSKPSTPKLALTNVNRSIQEAINLSSVTLRKSGIEIEKSLNEDLPQCFTDSYLIEQVLLNLITNAAQAMKNADGEKKIEVTSLMEGNHILIEVSDSGPGVPPLLRKKIFEPFFTTKKDSSGIGLSLCHRIITDHGGSLDVSTSRWGGSEFRIKIPIEKRMSTK